MKYSARLVFLVVAGAFACDAEVNRTHLRLNVPKALSDQAAKRLSGDVQTPPPILVLEGIELGENEGITFKVIGPANSGSSKQQILAIAGVVGAPQNDPKPPFQKVNLTVVLNDRAAEVLAGRREVTLALELTNGVRRPPLRVSKAFLRPAR